MSEDVIDLIQNRSCSLFVSVQSRCSKDILDMNIKLNLPMCISGSPAWPNGGLNGLNTRGSGFNSLILYNDRSLQIG